MNRKSIAISTAAIAAVVALTATGTALVSPSEAADVLPAAAVPGTVSVRGVGVATGAPDILRVSFGVNRQGPDVSTAIERSNSRVRLVRDALRKHDVAAKDIRTSSFDVGRNYSKRNPGYRANQTLSVTLRDLKKAGRVIADAVTAGGNSVNLYGVDFAIEDRDGLLKLARDAAYADALAKAQRYAELAGKTLGAVRVIDEGGPSYSYERYGYADGVAAAKAAAPAGSSVPLSAGSEKVSVTDKVVWELN